jgi:O-antigen/teichoic acid export membrane protein
MFSKKNIPLIQVLVQKGTRILFFMTISAVVLLAIYTQDILHFWLRKDISYESVMVMRIILLSIVPGGIFEIWLICLVGIGKLGWLTIVSALTVILAIMIAFILLSTEAVSAPVAAALALVTVLWLKLFVWMPWYGARQIGLPAKQYFCTSIVRAIAASIVTCVIIYMLEYRLIANCYWVVRFFASAVILVVGFGVIVLWADISPILKPILSKVKGRE